jgi:tetratricopeptide (TPR) repeat protein
MDTTSKYILRMIYEAVFDIINQLRELLTAIWKEVKGQQRTSNNMFDIEELCIKTSKLWGKAGILEIDSSKGMDIEVDEVNQPIDLWREVADAWQHGANGFQNLANNITEDDQVGKLEYIQEFKELVYNFTMLLHKFTKRGCRIAEKSRSQVDNLKELVDALNLIASLYRWMAYIYYATNKLERSANTLTNAVALFANILGIYRQNDQWVKEEGEGNVYDNLVYTWVNHVTITKRIVKIYRQANKLKEAGDMLERVVNFYCTISPLNEIDIVRKQVAVLLRKATKIHYKNNEPMKGYFVSLVHLFYFTKQ